MNLICNHKQQLIFIWSFESFHPGTSLTSEHLADAKIIAFPKETARSWLRRREPRRSSVLLTAQITSQLKGQAKLDLKGKQCWPSKGSKSKLELKQWVLKIHANTDLFIKRWKAEKLSFLRVWGMSLLSAACCPITTACVPSKTGLDFKIFEEECSLMPTAFTEMFSEDMREGLFCGCSQIVKCHHLGSHASLSMLTFCRRLLAIKWGSIVFIMGFKIFLKY